MNSHSFKLAWYEGQVRTSSFGLAAVVGLWAMSVAGCGASPEQPHGEIKTRKQIPIPVCSQQLSPVQSDGGGKAVVRSLEPEQWMSILVPSYTEEKGLNATDMDCTGNYIFVNESLRGGVSQRGWPRP